MNKTRIEIATLVVRIRLCDHGDEAKAIDDARRKLMSIKGVKSVAYDETMSRNEAFCINKQIEDPLGPFDH